MMVKIIGPACISVMLILACNNNANQEKVLKIDSLYSRVNDAEKKLLNIDTSKAGEYFRNSRDKLLIIQKEWNQDTMDRKTGIFLSDYRSTRKSLEKLLDMREDQVDEISYTKGQLDNFKTDLANNLLPEDKFQAYFEEESLAVARVQEISENMNSWYSTSIKRYEELNPGVEAIIDSLKTIKGNN